mgnify:FL=1
MSSGDYGWIANGIRYLWETKWDNGDFYSSLFSHRLKSQLQRCLREADRVFLGVKRIEPWEGWTQDSVNKLVWKFSCWGVQTVAANSSEELLGHIIDCYRVSKETYPLQEQQQVYTNIRAGSPMEVALRSMRIGVGPQKAALMSRRFKSLYELANASLYDYQLTLGEATGQKTWNVIHGNQE